MCFRAECPKNSGTSTGALRAQYQDVGASAGVRGCLRPRREVPHPRGPYLRYFLASVFSSSSCSAVRGGRARRAAPHVQCLQLRRRDRAWPCSPWGIGPGQMPRGGHRHAPDGCRADAHLCAAEGFLKRKMQAEPAAGKRAKVPDFIFEMVFSVRFSGAISERSVKNGGQSRARRPRLFAPRRRPLGYGAGLESLGDEAITRLSS